MTSYIYSDFTLYIAADKYYIQPKAVDSMLIIDRVSEVALVQKVDQAFRIPPPYNQRNFCGFLGAIKLLSGRYLVVLTTRELLGYIGNHAIWKLGKVELLPYCKSMLHLTSEQEADNNTYVNMIEEVLSTPYLYCSYSFDITHSMQRLHDFGPDFWNLSLIQRADERFIWNNHLLEDFKTPEMYNFCLPIIQGFISINQCVVNGSNFNLLLISRRSTLRSGARLFRRGIDSDGNVANFVETEQILECQGHRASFVQIRGSIPLFWSQWPNLKYKPPPTLTYDLEFGEHFIACQRHLEYMAALYGKQVIVNLVDHNGAEGRLEKAFRDAIQALSNSSIRYESFDFHAECKHMRWDRLSLLMDRIALEQDDLGYFLVLRDGSLMSLQEGVFRTNCIDCLDRTNVVQSMLAHRNLQTILTQINILRSNESLESHTSFEALFKNVWADNADVISTQYSGTPALKTDFTRTGKRTRLGLLKDGVNALTRYYKNNLCDGFRQDAIDLFHGNCDIVTPLNVSRSWRYVTFPSILLVAISMFVASAIFPAQYSTESLLYLFFWGSMVSATALTILRHGNEFVDRPRLLQ